MKYFILALGLLLFAEPALAHKDKHRYKYREHERYHERDHDYHREHKRDCRRTNSCKPKEVCVKIVRNNIALIVCENDHYRDRILY